MSEFSSFLLPFIIFDGWQAHKPSSLFVDFFFDQSGHHLLAELTCDDSNVQCLLFQNPVPTAMKPMRRGKKQKLSSNFEGSSDEVKEELYDFFGSAQVLLLTQNEKQTLRDGGKNCPLKDLSNQVEVVSIFNNLYLHVYGPEKAREKATTLVKKYLCFKNASK